MGSLHLSLDGFLEYTTISNRFIDDYMLEANDAQLKVYLYLVRMLSSHMSVSVSDIADKFNHTEREVTKALHYWERMGLLSLICNEDKELSGIRLETPGTRKEHFQPQLYVAASQTAEAVTTATVPKIPEKPSYSLDDMKAFKADENAAQLLFISEQYIGKPLSVGDVKSMMYIYQELKLNSDLIDYLIQYCVERGKRDFRYIEKVAITWAEAKISTAKEAAGYVQQSDKDTFAIMKALGRMTDPTTKEIDFISRWKRDYGFSKDIILEACNRAVLATDKHRFEYTDGILANWNKQNVHTINDILQTEENYKQAKNSSKGSIITTNKFNSFKQNTYDFSELEREILSN